MLGRLALTFAVSYIVIIGMASIARGAEQTQCNQKDIVFGQLEKKYGETPSAVGIGNTGVLVVVVSNAKTGSWTIVQTTPQGMACLMAAGEAWRKIVPVSTDPIS